MPAPVARTPRKYSVSAATWKTWAIIPSNINVLVMLVRLAHIVGLVVNSVPVVWIFGHRQKTLLFGIVAAASGRCSASYTFGTNGGAICIGRACVIVSSSLVGGFPRGRTQI